MRSQNSCKTRNTVEIGSQKLRTLKIENEVKQLQSLFDQNQREKSKFSKSVHMKGISGVKENRTKNH